MDLRLQRPKQYFLSIEISPGPAVPPEFEFAPLKGKPRRQDRQSIRSSKFTYGNRLSPELLSHFPQSADGGFMLDLGCGGRDFAEVCRSTGLEYIGLDRDGPYADVLGDAHALPFRDQTFEFILCVAVLEHLQHPLVAMREAYRVLKPSGLLIGTVAFLEPFHLDSYYHHSHLGIYNTLASAGFEVKQVAPNLEWTALHALANMNLFYGLSKRTTDLLVAPLRALNRLWWTWEDIRYQTHGTWEIWRQLSTTAGFRFVAAKPLRDVIQYAQEALSHVSVEPIMR